MITSSYPNEDKEKEFLREFTTRVKAESQPTKSLAPVLAYILDPWKIELKWRFSSAKEEAPLRPGDYV
jgi:hypothetical protein